MDDRKQAVVLKLLEHSRKALTQLWCPTSGWEFFLILFTPTLSMHALLNLKDYTALQLAIYAVGAYLWVIA